MTAGARAFENRLRKNVAKLARWAEAQGIDCYRVYDADIPEYAVAIDRYGPYVVVHELASPGSTPSEILAERLDDVLRGTAEVLGVPVEAIVRKLRKRHGPGEQYASDPTPAEPLTVREGALTFLVRLDGSIDTGLFPEQRALRAHAAEAARGKRFLNLFAYTCAAGVYAAHAGARDTTNVDLSRRYLAWGRDNYVANDLPLDAARFFAADCMDWLRRGRGRERYGIAYCNPPTFAHGRRGQRDFSVQRDHATLLRATMDRLEDDGATYFATHARGFELDETLRRDFVVEDLADACIPRDYRRHPFVTLRLTRR